MLGVRLDQRREIDVWIRSREVKFVLPQPVSVLELECICKSIVFQGYRSFDKVFVQHLSNKTHCGDTSSRVYLYVLCGTE